MIAGCPKCGARYRVDANRVGAEGAKLRCTKCSAVFLVRAPKTSGAEEAVAAAPPSPAEDDSGTTQVDRERLVLIADPNEEHGKSTAEAVASWGLVPRVVHDGVEAMLAVQRLLPPVIVLDAALPKMFGFQVCEVVKRNESLRSTRVVLVGAIHHKDRYRRNPSELYGADVYLEQPDLPDALLPHLREAGLPVVDSGAATSSPVTPLRTATPPAAESAAPSVEMPSAPPPAAESAAAGDPELAKEREHAERLARIAVSEMVLYQPEKFDQAAQQGSLERVLDMEIQEAKALLRQRIQEDVCNERDFVLDELRRVAAERSGGT